MGTIFSLIYYSKNKPNVNPQELMKVFAMGLLADACLVALYLANS